MNPLGASILTVLVLAVLSSPRRWAFVALMAGVLYLPEQQQINILGFNLFPTRFLELAGFIRVMSRHEFSFRQLNGIDRALIWLYGFTTVIYLLRSPEGAVYQIGILVDSLLSYFTFRGLLRDGADFRWFLRTFVFLLAPYTLLVVMEGLTGHNPFTVLGAVDGSSGSRNGRPRCDGSFQECDLLGMFAASFIPLFVGLACIPQERKRALLGVCLCLIIAWTANSGGAAGAAITGLACWGFWRFRTEMWKVRRGLVAVLVLMALVMKAPIWFIFDRMSSYVGGDGWHRSYLIDVALRHLGEWWFAGMSFYKTHDWFPYTLSNGVADVTDQYIVFGLMSGVGAIALFILLLTRAFSNLGRALAAARSSSQQSSADEFLLWGLGVMLVVHIINWFGITYFDQMDMVWFMQLAAIATLSQACLARPTTVTVEEAVIEPEMEAPQPTAGFGHAD
jgi:hypothetical protein